MIPEPAYAYWNNQLVYDNTTPASLHENSHLWPSPLIEDIIGNYLIVPITSTRFLNEESQQMYTSLQRYAFQCSAGNYSLFSIRSLSGERIATLGIIKRDGHWHFHHCSGVSGENILEEFLEYFDDDGVLHTEWLPTELYFISHEVVRLANAS